MRKLITTTLIIRFSSVGDIILTTPLLRVLRRSFPSSRIDFLVKSEYTPLLKDNPHLSRVIPLPPGDGFRALLELRSRVAREGYDMVVDLHDSLRSRAICAGHPRVYRVKKRKIARFTLVRFKRDLYNRFGGAPGVAERYLETIRHLGVVDDQEGTELFPSSSDHEAAEKLIPPMPRQWIGLCPAARHATKMWPADRFARAGAELALGLGSGVLLMGGPEDVDLCNAVERDMELLGRDFTVVNSAGRLTLLQCAALMDHCAVVIANDSGLMHVAAARKRPVVALFGSTVRQFGFVPYGTRSVVVERPDVRCRPCTHIGRASCPEGHFRCMNEITIDQVVGAVSSLLVE